MSHTPPRRHIGSLPRMSPASSGRMSPKVVNSSLDSPVAASSGVHAVLDGTVAKVVQFEPAWGVLALLRLARIPYEVENVSADECEAIGELPYVVCGSMVIPGSFVLDWVRDLTTFSSIRAGQMLDGSDELRSEAIAERSLLSRWCKRDDSGPDVYYYSGVRRIRDLSLGEKDGAAGMLLARAAASLELEAPESALDAGVRTAGPWRPSEVGSVRRGLDGHVSEERMAAMVGMRALVTGPLQEAASWSRWGHAERFERRTRPLWRSQRAFPLSLLPAGFLRSSILRNRSARGPALREETVRRSALEAYRALSDFLGDAEYFGGDRPCTLDAIVFGHLQETRHDAVADWLRTAARDEIAARRRWRALTQSDLEEEQDEAAVDIAADWLHLPLHTDSPSNLKSTQPPKQNLPIPKTPTLVRLELFRRRFGSRIFDPRSLAVQNMLTRGRSSKGEDDDRADKLRRQRWDDTFQSTATQKPTKYKDPEWVSQATPISQAVINVALLGSGALAMAFAVYIVASRARK